MIKKLEFFYNLCYNKNKKGEIFIIYYYIYMTTNLINGKKYIGQHKGPLNDSYLGSGTIIKKAIKQYGRENFQKEILCICDSRENANQQEKTYIKKFNAVEDNNFYNLDDGGYQQNIAQQYQKWKESNPEEYQKMCKESGKRLQKWRIENPEQYKAQCLKPFLAASHKWIKEHPEEVEQNITKMNQKKEEWQKNHPKEYKELQNKWRESGSKANSKPVINLTTGKIFPSQCEAGRYYKIPQGNISKCLTGKRHFAGQDPITKEKYKWAFYKEEK